MITLRPPHIVRARRISPLAALQELGLDVADVAQMKLDLRAALARNNNDLVHGFSETGRASGLAGPRSTRP